MGGIHSISDTTVKWAIQRQLNVKASAQTGSTNDDAKANALKESDAFVLYVTGHQTAGRGRGSNTWMDTGGGEGLLSTWSFSVPAAPQPIASPRIGLALFEAVNGVWPSLQWSLKAPNDLFLSGHKMGGLLLESVSSGNKHRLLVGLGLNILNHPRRFDADHLSATLHAAPDEGEWFQFLDELNQRLSQALDDCQRPQLSDTACRSLMNALNANPRRPFAITEVTPHGDLVHSKGRVHWMDL